MSSKAKRQSSKLVADRSAVAKPRYIMIGGFLGAGKTTAIMKLAQYLTDRRLRVGLITNDQGNDLVDTTVLAARGFPVQEISGGCFCCRFSSLTEAARKLSEEARPEVFVAEPVGSCTDIVATVSYPLRRMYGDNFMIAPVSVMVDPIRALRIFGMEDGGRFSDKVQYIYRKQLEEADLIIINKCDLLDAGRMARLRARVAQEFPRAEMFEVSARDAFGLQHWFQRITTAQQTPRPVMEVDYTVYGEGEALLGWLNATVQLSSSTAFNGNNVLQRLAVTLQQSLSAAGAEIAHLKMTLDPQNGFGDLGVINLVRNDYLPELSQELPDRVLDGELILNVRAEAAPQILSEIVQHSLKDSVERQGRIIATVDHIESFRPGQPQPEWRIATPESE